MVTQGCHHELLNSTGRTQSNMEDSPKNVTRQQQQPKKQNWLEANLASYQHFQPFKK